MAKGDPIPDGQILFRYAKPSAFPEGQSELPSSLFNDPELSCDWQAYRANPETSFHIQEGRTEIVAITICDAIRNPTNPKRQGEKVAAWQQAIIHDPLSQEDDPQHGANEAHALIKGKKKMAVVNAIRDNSQRYKPSDLSGPDTTT